MKPKKNKIFCLGCNRTKMRFETEAKADNFIKYNRLVILRENGKAPVRSYYCAFCCGFHVTSNPSVIAGERLDKQDKQRLEHILAANCS